MSERVKVFHVTTNKPYVLAEFIHQSEIVLQSQRVLSIDERDLVHYELVASADEDTSRFERLIDNSLSVRIDAMRPFARLMLEA